VAGEVTADLAFRASKSCELVSLDLQGFLRSFTRDGRTFLKGEAPRAILRECDIVKGSIEEIFAMTGSSSIERGIKKVRSMGPSIVIATLGSRGAVIGDELSYVIPALKTRVRDTTGAGDAFVGRFLREYLRSGDIVWSAAMGGAAASYAVEALGPWGLASMSELTERATIIYERAYLM